ncbi:MAG: hypothetical protein N3A69_16020, partial [Leptospiraceae bacterium]|nr:hypothetical protein [Leptospiraceae bacterium]
MCIRDRDKEEPIGNRVRVKVVKNKCAPPFKQAEFDIYFSNGISREGSILDLAVKHELIQKSGAWYSYNGEKIGQGRDQAKAFLEQNPDIANKLEDQILYLNDLPPRNGTKLDISKALLSSNGSGKTGKSKKSAIEEEIEEAEEV